MNNQALVDAIKVLRAATNLQTTLTVGSEEYKIAKQATKDAWADYHSRLIGSSSVEIADAWTKG
jgi:hypothetical protein